MSYAPVSNMWLFPQIATDAIENIRTVASLSKEAHFVSEYNKLTDMPYKCVDLVIFTSVNYIKLNYSENDIHFCHYSRVNNEGSVTNLMQTSFYGLLWYLRVFEAK